MESCLKGQVYNKYIDCCFPPTRLQKLKVDVSMHFEFPAEVVLSVYEKEREDERGEISEQLNMHGSNLL